MNVAASLLSVSTSWKTLSKYQAVGRNAFFAWSELMRNSCHHPFKICLKSRGLVDTQSGDNVSMRLDGTSIATFRTAKLCAQRLFVVLCHPRVYSVLKLFLFHLRITNGSPCVNATSFTVIADRARARGCPCGRLCLPLYSIVFSITSIKKKARYCTVLAHADGVRVV